MFVEKWEWQLTIQYEAPPEMWHWIDELMETSFDLHVLDDPLNEISIQSNESANKRAKYDINDVSKSRMGSKTDLPG